MEFDEFIGRGNSTRMISEPAYSMIDSFADELHKHLNDWIDEFMAHYSGFIGDCEIDQGTSMTRFNQLVDLARNNYPNDKDGKLQWVWWWLYAALLTNL